MKGDLQEAQEEDPEGIVPLRAVLMAAVTAAEENPLFDGVYAAFVRSEKDGLIGKL